ncbi:LysR family transcriptional regulator [Paenibacillus sp. F411]|uniref:LysR family transcriptional regulator n=1 Tax=Paenibacillus sp. F411 TaxID=2820239 RepID=UPI001AAFECC1|nr:LysR family transcriptional regulator [Paenibacillus sp. F411]MBO2944302.1 LysR family transcriptional regulator [Paenibacillus sp. F411]
MDIRQLKYFLAIAREGQVTRAAKKLNMEQPPLSRQLKQIEEELGVRLFDRSSRHLKLTSAGVLLRQRGELLLTQFEEALNEVKETEEGVRGMLSIGSVVSCVSLLPGRIQRMREVYPRLTYKIVEGDHTYLGDLLQKRVIELIVARLPFEAFHYTDPCEVLPLPSDPFVAVIPSAWASRFGGKSAIKMTELAECPILTLKTDYTTRMHESIMNECRKHGFEPQVICECSSVSIIMSLVAEGIGVTIFPKSVMSMSMGRLVTMLDIEDAALQSEVGIVWLKNHYLSKSAERFIDSFRSDPNNNP